MEPIGVFDINKMVKYISENFGEEKAKKCKEENEANITYFSQKFQKEVCLLL